MYRSLAANGVQRMTVKPRTRAALRSGLQFIGIGTAAGALLGLAGSGVLDLYVCLLCTLEGAIVGFLVVTPIVLFEVLVMQGRPGERILRLPFVAVMGIRKLVYLASILIGLSCGRIIWDAGEIGFSMERFGSDAAIAFLGAFALVFYIQVNRMLGGGLLEKFVSGRYQRPREEERVFLFVDLVSSTRIAESIGNVRFHELLNAITFDLTDPVLEHGGEIYRYVGDQIIITWPAAAGLGDAAAVRCCFAILDKMASLEPDYHGRFGVAPRFHAALHCGPVVSGEMGDVRREIVYLGDVLNTTARMEEACREMRHPVIASKALLDRLRLPAGIAARSIGPIQLRGKEQDVGLHALSRDTVLAAAAE